MKGKRKTSSGACLGWVLAACWLASNCAWSAQPEATAGQPEGKAPPARLLYLVEGYGKNVPFKKPEGIWFDRYQQEVYVADTGNGRISVFDNRGVWLRSFTHWVGRKSASGKAILQPGEPKSIAVNRRGEIFVVDALASYLDVLDYRGRSLTKLEAAELVKSEEETTAPGPVTPTEVTLDAADRVYVGLGGSHNQIVVLDQDLKVVRRIGRRGREKGAFFSITGLATTGDGRMIVTDSASTPVQVFSAAGELLLHFGSHDVGWQNFSLPSGAVCDGAGSIWVADAVRQVVKKFDAQGSYVTALGGFGVRPGEMRYPVALAGDGGKLLFVLEKVGGRYQVFEVNS